MKIDQAIHKLVGKDVRHHTDMDYFKRANGITGNKLPAGDHSPEKRPEYQSLLEDLESLRLNVRGKTLHTFAESNSYRYEQLYNEAVREGNEKNELDYGYSCFFSHVVSDDSETDDIEAFSQMFDFEEMAWGNSKLRTTEEVADNLFNAIVRRQSARLMKYLEAMNLKARAERDSAYFNQIMGPLMKSDFRNCVVYILFKQAYMGLVRRQPMKETNAINEIADLPLAATASTVDEKKYFALIEVGDKMYKYVHETESDISFRGMPVISKAEEGISLDEFKRRVLRLSLRRRKDGGMKLVKNNVCLTDGGRITLANITALLAA